MLQWLRHPIIFLWMPAFLFGLFVWPTPWSNHFDKRGFVVRVSRFTGSAEAIRVTPPDEKSDERPRLLAKFSINPRRAADIHRRYTEARTDVEATGILVEEIVNAILEGTSQGTDSAWQIDWWKTNGLAALLTVGLVASVVLYRRRRPKKT